MPSDPVGPMIDVGELLHLKSNYGAACASVLALGFSNIARADNHWAVVNKIQDEIFVGLSLDEREWVLEQLMKKFSEDQFYDENPSWRE